MPSHSLSDHQKNCEIFTAIRQKFLMSWGSDSVPSLHNGRTCSKLPRCALVEMKNQSPATSLLRRGRKSRSVPWFINDERVKFLASVTGDDRISWRFLIRLEPWQPQFNFSL
jgi:hypothetical protein